MKSEDADLFTFTKAGAGWCLWQTWNMAGLIKKNNMRVVVKPDWTVFFYFDLWIAKSPKGILPRFLSAYHRCPFPFCTSENVLGQNLILQFALIEASVLPKIMNFPNGPPRDPVASNGTQDGKWLMQGAAWKENDDDQDWWNMAKHGLQWMAVFGFWWGKKLPPRFIHVFMPQRSR